MAVATVIEINAASKNSFEDAIAAGIAKASETVREILAAWVSEQQVTVRSTRSNWSRVMVDTEPERAAPS